MYVCIGKVNYLKQNPPYQLGSTLPYLLVNIFLKLFIYQEHISSPVYREIYTNDFQTIPSSNNK